MAPVPPLISGNQLRKLGERLARDDRISEDDYNLLERVAGVYQATLDEVDERLRRVGFQATTRVKTTGTLVEKLRRDSTLKLNQVHDLAGARIVVDGPREQDQAVERIKMEFESCPKACTVKDRRQAPSFGYRAVHVIVFPEGVPVEIQVRTALQDAWAQIVEKLGDRWGRGIRYGAGPDRPDEAADEAAAADVGFAAGLTRSQVVDGMMELADRMATFESAASAERLVAEEMLVLDPEDRAECLPRTAEVTARYAAASEALDNTLRRLSGSTNTQGDSG